MSAKSELLDVLNDLGPGATLEDLAERLRADVAAEELGRPGATITFVGTDIQMDPRHQSMSTDRIMSSFLESIEDAGPTR